MTPERCRSPLPSLERSSRLENDVKPASQSSSGWHRGSVGLMMPTVAPQQRQNGARTTLFGPQQRITVPNTTLIARNDVKRCLFNHQTCAKMAPSHLRRRVTPVTSNSAQNETTLGRRCKGDTEPSFYALRLVLFCLDFLLFVFFDFQ